MEYYINPTSDMPVQLVSPSWVPPQNGDPNPTVVYVNPSLDTNCENAARDVVALIEKMGLTSYKEWNPIELEEEIASLIKKNISGNVNFKLVK